MNRHLQGFPLFWYDRARRPVVRPAWFMLAVNVRSNRANAFSMLEQPELFAAELRAAFRSLRDQQLGKR